MGVVLYNEYLEGIGFNWGAWGKLTRIAERYGWIPKGTEYPPFDKRDETREEYERGRRPWSGGYDTNDTQVVTADDAKALADALERALLDMPDEEPPEKSRAEIAALSAAESEVRCCSGPAAKAWVRDFIEFAREGSFRIG